MVSDDAKRVNYLSEIIHLRDSSLMDCIHNFVDTGLTVRQALDVMASYDMYKINKRIHPCPYCMSPNVELGFSFTNLHCVICNVCHSQGPCHYNPDMAIRLYNKLEL